MISFPCYDPEKDTLYYFKDGELWAVPQFDMTRTEAVNDCPDNGYGMFLLPVLTIVELVKLN